MTPTEIDSLAWEKGKGLLPAVIQNASTLQVLMVGYMNREALLATLETGKITFHSRSKGRLWRKGETSGNELELVSLSSDCDGDTLLVQALPKGPTCHRATASCFGDEEAPGLGFLGRLSDVIDRRYRDRPEGSYTTRLFEEGLDRMAQKVGEEGVEVVIASKNESREAMKGEAADLLFHLLVLLRAKEVPFSEVIETLRGRHSPR